MLPSLAHRTVTLSTRKAIARMILLVLIVLAAISAGRRDAHFTGPLGPVSLDRQFLAHVFDDLNQLPSVHILAHSVGFALVALLLGPWGAGEKRGSIALVTAYTAVGSILWETAQALAWSTTVILTTHAAFVTHIERTYNRAFVSETLFDFLVDGLAALAGVGILCLLRGRFAARSEDST